MYDIKCKLCQYITSPNDANHIIFICPAVNDIRQVKLDVFISKCPVPLHKSWELMSTENKLVLMLSGFRIRYTPEWVSLYHAAADFVAGVYRKYSTLCSI